MRLFYKRNKKICISTLIGFLFVCILGTLFHFVYDWSGQSSFVGLITPVNESIWEHMKLIYFPGLLFFAIEFPFLYRTTPRLFRSDITGLLYGTLLVPVLFYTYTGILGYHTMFMDILIFIVSVFTAFFVRFNFLVSTTHKKFIFVYFLAVLILGVCFLIFTFYPPAIALFVSPV